MNNLVNCRWCPIRSEKPPNQAAHKFYSKRSWNTWIVCDDCASLPLFSESIKLEYKLRRRSSDDLPTN